MDNDTRKIIYRLMIGGGLLLCTVVGLWLWKIGDTPAQLPSHMHPRKLAVLIVSCATLLFSGIGMWIKHGGPREKLKRRIVIAVLSMTLFTGTLFGVTFGIYAAWYDRGREICRGAERLPTIKKRRALIETARGWQDAQFGDALDTIFTCSLIKYELDELEKEGKCPEFPMPGVPCKCGEDDKWPKDMGCGNVPVVCHMRTELRCAEESH